MSSLVCDLERMEYCVLVHDLGARAGTGEHGSACAARFEKVHRQRH